MDESARTMQALSPLQRRARSSHGTGGGELLVAGGALEVGGGSALAPRAPSTAMAIDNVARRARMGRFYRPFVSRAGI